MQFTIAPKITTEKPSKERILQLVRVALYTVGFTGIILHLNEYDNMTAQALRDRQSAYALFFFLLILMTLQKVKMINWQSLAVTLVYAPIAFFRVQPVLGSPDLLPGTIISQITFWMALMIITDMAVTRRVRKFKEMNLWLLGFMAVMVGLLIFYRQTRAWPVTYAYFLILCFIPVEEDEWGRAFGGLLNAGVLSFALVTLLSFKLNPHIVTKVIESEEAMEPGKGGRWYGYFLNIGTFGQFCGLQVALSFLSIIRAKDKFGRFGIVYGASLIWFAGACFLGFLCGTDDLLLGTIVLVIVALVFGFKKTKFPHLAVRILIALGLICLFGFFVVDGINRVAAVGFEPAKVRAMVDKTPLRLFPWATDTIVNKITAFHNLNNPYTDYITNPVKMFLNYLGSSRPGIWEVFVKHTTFKGTDSPGLMYRSYFAYGAHNQFVQVLYEQGILSGGLNILFFVSGWIASIVGYVKTKKEQFFVPVILVPMALAMWMGESSPISFALTFMAFFVMMPTVMNHLNARKAEEEKKEEEKKALSRVARNGAAAAVVFAAIFAVVTCFLLVRRINKNNKSYLVNGERYVQLAEAEEETLVDNGLYSSEDILDKSVKGSILLDYDKIRQIGQRASWGDRAFLSFDVEGAVPGDSLVMEFTAETTETEPILLTVSYSGQKTTVEVDKGKSRYFLPFNGEDSVRNVLFTYDLPEGANQSLLLSNIRLADYGKDRLRSSLKIGEYSVSEYNQVNVPMDAEKFIRSTSAVSAGAYVYSLYAGELIVYRGENLTEVTRLKGLGDTQTLCLSEDNKKLLISSKGSGITLVDISRPDTPTILSKYNTLEFVYNADISGNYAFLCNRYFGIEVVDISDATNPKYVTKIQYPRDAEYQSCYVYNGYLYAAAKSQKRVDVYDVNDLSNIQQVSYLDVHGQPYGMAAKDDALYVSLATNSVQKAANGYATGTGCGMDVFDISHPDYPALLAVERIDGRIGSQPQGVWDLAIDGNNAYLSIGSGGLYIYDISAPSEPKRLSVVTISVGKDSDLFKEQDPEKVYSNYDYSDEMRGNITHAAVGSSGVFCVAPDMGLFRAPVDVKAQGRPDKGTKPTKGEVVVEEPEAPEGYSIQVLHPEGCIYALASIEDRQFVAACGSTGLKVMDKQMHTICSLETGHTVTDVKVVGDLVYTAESEGGFAIYKYENGLLNEVGRITDTAWNAYVSSLLVSEDGTFVLAQAGTGRYRLIDCTNPESPAFIKTPAEDGVWGMYHRNLATGIVGGKYYGVVGSNRTLWFAQDGTDAETGLIKLKYVKDESAVKVNEFNGIAPLGNDCLVLTDKGYRIVNPEKGDVIEPVENPDFVFQGKPITDGNKVIISEAHEGKITIVDFTNRTTPVVEMRLDTPYVTDVPCLMDGEIYVPLRHDGILIITKN